MNNRNNPPDIDPANNESLAGTIRFAFQKLAAGLCGMLPCKVIGYDRAADPTRIQVQLMISLRGTSGDIVPRPQIASIPVYTMGGGGLFISFPYQVGDLGWVLASDRDISLFLQTYQQSPPNTNRIMDFSDGVFLPDVMTDYVINTPDLNNAVISTTDGTIRISIGTTGVTITSPTVTVDGALVVNGALSATSFGIAGSGLSMVQLPIGTLHLHGNFTASGSITPSVPP